MITTALTESDISESAPDRALSEESERQILEMVEEQLDRRNPPDTKVLYRRAMHFVDRGVRHLTLQQFNAKFPLQVKRRRASDGREQTDSPGDSAEPGEGSAGEGAGRTNGRDGRSERGEDGASAAGSPAEEELRDRVRSSLLDFAELVAGAESRADLIEVIPRVDEYVERVVEPG